MTGPRRVVSVVLAAGKSSRFPGDKLLQPFRGKPLAAHVADTLAEDSFAIAIVPPAHPERAELFSSRGFAVVENPHAEHGMGTSLARAASVALTLDIEADAMLVCLADMPLVTRAHLDALLAVDADVVATEANGVRSPPIVFARSVFPELMKLTGDTGPRHLLKSAATVQADPAIVRDFDTPEDFL